VIPGPIDSTALPPENRASDGFCVRLGMVVGGTYNASEKTFFWGPDAEGRANEYYSSLYDPENTDGLDPGTYHLTLHLAWRGSDIEPNDYDELELKALTFDLKRQTTIQVIHER